MRSVAPGILIALALLVFAISNVFFTVSETEQAILLQFGKPENVIKSAGLNIKVPFIQNVVKFDKRILTVDDASEVPDKDRQRLKVDAFVRYRIARPLDFYQTLTTESNANERIQSLLTSSLRNVIANSTIGAVLSQDRDQVMGSIRHEVAASAKDFGIDVIDVQIRRTDLPEQNVDSIINRMVAERQREANEARAEGSEIENRIKSQADRDQTVILAEANKQSEILRGEGDGERNRIYAEAYSRDAEFFAFYRSMLAYGKALDAKNTTMVVSPTGQFFQYFANDKSK